MDESFLILSLVLMGWVLVMIIVGVAWVWPRRGGRRK